MAVVIKQKRTSVVLVVVAVMAIVVFGVIHYVTLSTSEWVMTQYADVGGAQAMFYTLKNSRTGSLIVIDGGWSDNADYVRSVINENGGEVDAWIVTHFHEDHCGAYNAVVKDPQGIKIKQVYASKFDSDYEKFLEVAKDWDNVDTMKAWMDTSANAENVYYPKRSESITIDDAKITFLNTYDEKLKEVIGDQDLPNNVSLVLLFETGDSSALFMGDMYAPDMIDYLMDTYGDILKVDYLQAPHHGNSIVGDYFYDFVQPGTILFDAPEWLMIGEEYRAKDLEKWCEDNDVEVSDFRTAPNEFIME